jgi:hypothetical protein
LWKYVDGIMWGKTGDTPSPIGAVEDAFLRRGGHNSINVGSVLHIIFVLAL